MKQIVRAGFLALALGAVVAPPPPAHAGTAITDLASLRRQRAEKFEPILARTYDSEGAFLEAFWEALEDGPRSSWCFSSCIATEGLAREILVEAARWMKVRGRIRIVPDIDDTKIVPPDPPPAPCVEGLFGQGTCTGTAPVPEKRPSSEVRVHTVRSGETFGQIASQHVWETDEVLWELLRDRGLLVAILDAYQREANPELLEARRVRGLTWNPSRIWRGDTLLLPDRAWMRTWARARGVPVPPEFLPVHQGA